MRSSAAAFVARARKQLEWLELPGGGWTSQAVCVCDLCMVFVCVCVCEWSACGCVCPCAWAAGCLRIGVATENRSGDSENKVAAQDLGAG